MVSARSGYCAAAGTTEPAIRMMASTDSSAWDMRGLQGQGRSVPECEGGPREMSTLVRCPRPASAVRSRPGGRMTRIDPVRATVAELSRAYGEGVLSPVDVVDALLERIHKRDPGLHAFIAVYEADARLAAEAAHKAIRARHRVGPLHGVPIALKDLVDLEGRVTTGGSKVWAERVSPVTATLAERLIAAGMIVLGKTHTVEFAMGSFGTNTHLGTPRNPWDLAVHRTPGGSSSGSAVAVAAGLAPAAIGTDTGGSVRRSEERRVGQERRSTLSHTGQCTEGRYVHHP